ncbi:VOC family protein [uncultured Sphingomonas sp.]|uniref:VOC family protein n=1 Tax=uncultured Sphingomonas sp. TaxID=158754 RepID=UPI00258D9569|nr:VOC family protein [uncultured Sphingomonas sp.]
MNRQGDFIWYELLTRDIDAAAAFYGDVIGWTVQDSGMPGMDYRLFVAPDGTMVGGLMAMPGGMPDPIWLGYVAVDDVDATPGLCRRRGHAAYAADHPARRRPHGDAGRSAARPALRHAQ